MDEALDPLYDARRQQPRWYLHDGQTPFEQQSCGITARLMVSGLLFDRRLCRVIIKDIGPGGVGFLAPRRFELPRSLRLVLPGLPPLDCLLMHRRPVGPSLSFIGGAWAEPDAVDLAPVLSRWRQHFIATSGVAFPEDPEGH
ncbi:hypothetical protein ACKC5O_14675 [Aeromonas schubertii]|uniref:PilZ domain-containing protein n=1 Tax=Aeromonas schubertii TaxID=652 RepID=A0A0S2SLV2_9GAMM|nr:hypothetical protein [Aeromonas schubertii]ALP42725.1 hypothetical protein WL1483_3306 [Aeromonas schubertii]MBZ6067073.1 hypothetical protein [Aeromonas schubertii]